MSARTPGRPRDHDKSTAMIDAAGDVFFERGYANTTIEGIAERAGVSKVTIYARFGDKAGLFEAMVKHVSARMETGAPHQGQLPANTEEALICYGISLMTQLMSPRLVAFERNLASELVRHPDLARRFYDAGPGRSRATLAAIIQGAVDRNELAVEHPMQAAADLYGLWHGFHMIEAHFGIGELPNDEKIQILVRSGVAKFLKMCRP